MVLIILAVVVWIACGIGAAGIVCAETNTRNEQFPLWSATELKKKKRDNLSFSLTWGILGGPISLVVALGSTGFAQYGWRLR